VGICSRDQKLRTLGAFREAGRFLREEWHKSFLTVKFVEGETLRKSIIGEVLNWKRSSMKSFELEKITLRRFFN
jgi:hypothetical protein